MADEGADAGVAEEKDDAPAEAKEDSEEKAAPSDAPEKAAPSDAPEKAAPSEAAEKAAPASEAEGEAPAVSDQAIVIDFSSGAVKAGLAGGDAPTAVFPAIVGRPRHQGVMVGMGQKDAYVGDEAQAKRGILNLRVPIVDGQVEDWDGLEKLIHHAYVNELRVASESYPVLVAAHPMASPDFRERLARYLFETMNVPALQVVSTPVLSVYAAGRTSGLVVEVDQGGGAVVPVYEGYVLPHAVKRTSVTDRDITTYLVKLLAERGQSFPSPAEVELIRDLKEKNAYVALDFEQAMKESEGRPPRPRPLGDDREVTVGNELFRAPEILFQPQLAGEAGPGLHQLVHEAIQQCDEAIRAELYGNVMLSGGAVGYKGMAERLQKELAALAGVNVQVAPIPDRKYSIWIGGSILSSTASFKPMWITRADYRKEGPAILKRRAF